ncbi:conserved hypothetical protein [Talaromyces stipitatus ATCC 10500]|uniref:Rhodopsin domain-containing protein n=1 Tax=Talaromyces stipitatus (strain ATCC 10500 / CBS 375.48 / QM 6759 / NRRL 1006) TaxID=441959 RepID=B8MGV2_TALSN|nr:uncharacterized protein TSTA_014250 [Talaromyces stipitatus ATCC 10500]EED16334.1 conserved hypothetical protein [Talaromyces stipitatus ATCC 10500]
MIIGTQIGEMAQHQMSEYDSSGHPIYMQTLANYEKCNYILQLLPLASLGFSKTSVLCFYRRVFFISHRFMIVNTVLIVVVVLWAVSFFFATAFQCRDPTTLWSTFEYARTNCVDTIPFYYAVSISGFITDIMILASPLPVIYRLRLPLKSRIAVAGIFLLGTVCVPHPSRYLDECHVIINKSSVCGAGIARFVTFVNIGHGIFANINDITYFTTPVFVWTVIESSLAVVGANLPLLRSIPLKRAYISYFPTGSKNRFQSSRKRHLLENGNNSLPRYDYMDKGAPLTGLSDNNTELSGAP